MARITPRNLFTLRAPRRSAKKVRPRIEQLEGRIAPALFNVMSSVALGAPKNFGCVATGDFNGDGKTDIVMTNYGYQDLFTGALIAGNTFLVKLGNGDGTFGGTSTFTVGTDQLVSYVAVGDINHDTKVDLAVVSSNLADTSGMLRIYLGNGSGGFTLSTQGAIPTGSNNACWVGIAQMTNGDTNPDVVVSAFGSTDQGQTTVFGNAITVFQGDGTGAVNNIGTITDGISFLPTALALADFNNDGKMDIAATVPGVPPDDTSPQPNGTVQIITGNGAGGFTLGNSFDSGGALPINIQAAYLNGDNLPDLVIANAGDPDQPNGFANFGSNNSVGVAINAGGGSFNSNSMTTGLGVGGSKSVFAVATADFDLDGKQDIAAIVYGNPGTGANARVLEFKGDGAGGFAADADSPFNTATTDGQFLAVAPLDANGSPDIVYCTAAGRYGVLTNTTVAAPTVTINQAASQSDPTNVSPISYTVHFSEAVTGFDGSDILFTGSTVGGTLVAGVTGSGQDYTVTVTGMSGTGTVKATIPAGAATGASGQNLASTSTDNTVTFDGTPPTVTINQAAGQADPTQSGPIQFTVVFSENVTGFTSSDVDLSSSSLTGLNAAVTQNSPSNYTVSVTGMSGSGTVVAKVKAGAATDTAGNTSAASTSTDNSVFFGTGPSVTINQAAGQADPTNSSSISYTVHFSEAVTGFDGSDILFTGSTVGGTLAAGVTGSGQDYTVNVTGMSGAGTVVASVIAGAAVSSVGAGSSASTSTDNTVTFDGISPTVTINQAVGQADPTNISSIKFDVKFSEAMTGFTAADVSTAGSTTGGTLSVNVTGSLDTYVVTVTGMTTSGSVIASIPAGGATDPVGNPNLSSTSTDNSVGFINNGVLGFAQAEFSVSEDGGSFLVTVSRTGQTDGAVSIDYSTADNTAHHGGPATRGQDDYTPASGTLSWADGEGGDKTFPIPILQDGLNEGKELINLSLTNAVGFPGLGLTSAVLAIEPSDGQGPGKYLDTDGDKYLITLSGPKAGSLLYYRTDPDGDSRGPIELIQLTGTTPYLQPRANVLSITVTKSLTSTDGGTVGLGAITGTPVRRIYAPKATLNLEGIDLSGYVAGIRLGSIANGADITTLASTLNPLHKTAINVLAIGNDTTINVGAPISSLTATRIGVGSIVAPRLVSMVVRGQPLFGVLGDMASDITLSGDGMPTNSRALGYLSVAGSIPDGADIVASSVGTIIVKRDLAGDIRVSGDHLDPGLRALSALRVVGSVSDSFIKVDGNVGGVRVGAFRNSRLFAGYEGADDGTGQFTKQATVASFVSTGKFNGFENSRLIATAFVNAWIASLDSTNPSPFGFYADVRLGAITVVSPLKFIYDPTISAPQGIGAFEVAIV